MTAPQVDPNVERNVESVERIAQLTAEHRRLEQRLAELEQHLSLSPAEQRERAEIKKAKLHLKDELLHLRRGG
jgi:uncharacterized protein YdcH (DUF465 family)